MADTRADSLNALLAHASAFDVDDHERWKLLDEAVRAPARTLQALPELLAAAAHPEARATLADLVGRLAESRPAELPEPTGHQLRRWLEPPSGPNVLIATLAALRRLRDHDSLEAILPLAAHPDPDVRGQVALTLEALLDQENHDQPAQTLVRLAADPCVGVRGWAVHALGSLLRAHPDEALLAALRERAHDEHDDVRCEALRGLALSGDREALTSALERCDPDRDLVALASTVGDQPDVHCALLELQARGWVGDQELLGKAIKSTEPPPDPSRVTGPAGRR